MKKSMLPVIALFVVASSLAKITVNGEAIDTVAEPGQTISYTDESTDNVAFSFEDNALSLGSATITNLAQIADAYNNILSNKEQLSKFGGGEQIALHAGITNTINYRYLSCSKDMIIQADDLVSIDNSLLEAKEIYLVGNNIELSGCFIKDADFIQLQAIDPETSLFQAIRFRFSKTSPYPRLLQGSINLVNGKLEGTFVAVGSYKIDILFSDRAFDETSDTQAILLR